MECALTEARLHELDLITKVKQLNIDEDSAAELDLKTSLSETYPEARKVCLQTSLSEAAINDCNRNGMQGRKGSNSTFNDGNEHTKGENPVSPDESRRDSGEVSFDEADLTRLEVGFDLEKCVCCFVDGGHTLVHSIAGKGYGYASTPISSGCYQWKVRRLSDYLPK